jgi:cytochrome bd-type quinol oxidase subunit 2
MMSSLIYGLCAAVALLCAVLLLAAWRRQGHKLLLWSGLCFAGFTINNILLVLDKVVYPDVDLSVWRTGVAALSIAVLLYGLIWDAD